MTRTFLAFALVSTSVVLAACGSDDGAGSTGSGGTGNTSSGAGNSTGDGGDSSDTDSGSGPSGPASSAGSGDSSSSAGGGGEPGTGGGPASGACTNAADQQVMMSKDVEALVEKCASDNFGGEPATKQCIKDSTGLSDSCVTCFDDTVVCTVSNCIGDCIGGQTPACDACMEANCMPAFETCSGLMM